MTTTLRQLLTEAIEGNQAAVDALPGGRVQMIDQNTVNTSITFDARAMLSRVRQILADDFKDVSILDEAFPPPIPETELGEKDQALMIFFEEGDDFMWSRLPLEPGEEIILHDRYTDGPETGVRSVWYSRDTENSGRLVSMLPFTGASLRVCVNFLNPFANNFQKEGGIHLTFKYIDGQFEITEAYIDDKPGSIEGQDWTYNFFSERDLETGKWTISQS